MVKVRRGLAVELTRMMKNWLFIHEYAGESVSTRLEATRRRQLYVLHPSHTTQMGRTYTPMIGGRSRPYTHNVRSARARSLTGVGR